MSERVSIIIPLHRWSEAARRSVEGALAEAGDEHEVIVVSDRPIDEVPTAARRITTGSPEDTSPAEKRDHVLGMVEGTITAFLDDDAWPAEGWLDAALRRFEASGCAAVGGPGLTPEGSSFAEELGGAFYESRLGSGGLRHRFVSTGGVRPVDDWPAFNFFVRTDVLRDIGGWGSKFYGGEDTKLCLELIEAGHEILYDPDVVVLHQRRRMFRPHMRQVGNVGRHRGWFVRRYPSTSARPIYFGPSVALVGGLASVALGVRTARGRRTLAAAGAAGWAALAGAALAEGFRPAIAAAHPFGLVAGHSAYAIGFLDGLLLVREIDAM